MKRCRRTATTKNSFSWKCHAVGKWHLWFDSRVYMSASSTSGMLRWSFHSCLFTWELWQKNHQFDTLASFSSGRLIGVTSTWSSFCQKGWTDWKSLSFPVKLMPLSFFKRTVTSFKWHVAVVAVAAVVVVAAAAALFCHLFSVVDVVLAANTPLSLSLSLTHTLAHYLVHGMLMLMITNKHTLSPMHTHTSAQTHTHHTHLNTP